MQFTVEPDRRGRLTVAGCEIAWARWAPDRDGPPAGVPILLVHGAGAHLGWWDAVIAALSGAGHDIVAVECSGHGDSGHRPDYTGAGWAEEIIAVAREVAGRPALLVGHSLGGRLAVLAGARAPGAFPRLVLIDAPFRAPGDQTRMTPPRTLHPRTHPTLEQAVDAFRLRPREPVRDTALLRRVAAGAYAEVEGGWRLKADLSVFARTSDAELAEALAALRQPVTFVLGIHSTVVTADRVAFLRDAHAGETEVVALDGHHHLTFDRAADLAKIIDARAALPAG